MEGATSDRNAQIDGNGRRKRAARLGPEVRRPMILDAAYHAFLEHGFDGASMATIADRAGVTKPVIYDSFANKDELFDALRDRERDRIMAAVVAELPPDPTVDLEASAIAALTALLRYVKSGPEAFRLILLGEGASGEAADRIRERREEFVLTAAAMLDDWGEDTDGPGDGVLLIASTLVGAVEGVARAVMNDPERFDPEAAAQLVGSLVARGTTAL